MSQPITAKDIEPEQYAAWRNHPVTTVMFQYFRDMAETLQQKMLADWRAGAINLSTEMEARGRVAAITEIPDLAWVSVQEFYGIKPKEEEEEPENVG